MSHTEIPVKINIKTTIDEQESIELVVFGRYQQRDKAAFLQYEEVMDEGNVRTIVKVTDQDALILRGGAVKMRLPFRMDQELIGSYELPLGLFDTTTRTHKLAHTYENGTGQIEIHYDFSFQGSHAGTYHLEIRFQEERT